MPAIPAGDLRKGHRVIQHDNTIKIVVDVKDVIPTCLAESFITYHDGTTEQFCNMKNITVQSSIPDTKVLKHDPV